MVASRSTQEPSGIVKILILTGSLRSGSFSGKLAGAAQEVAPEFNYGIPAPLKNAIDWASRPAYRSAIKDKASLNITHSIAPTGGVRAELPLASVLKGSATPTFVGPGFSIPAVHEKFDASGALIDDMTRLRLSKTLENFCSWAETRKD